MSDPNDFVPDDLQLAKMVGKKLAYRLNGLFSGGLCGLAVGCSLDSILPGAFKGNCAFIEVLRATETTFGAQSKKDFVRLMEELEDHFYRFHDCYVLLNQQRQRDAGIIETNVNELLNAYLDLLELEQTFWEFLGLAENDLSRYKAEAKLIVVGFLHEVGVLPTKGDADRFGDSE